MCHRCLRLIFVLIPSALLVACFTSPYEVSPPSDVAAKVREATPLGASARTTIAICYNGVSDTPAEVMEQAREACPHGGGGSPDVVYDFRAPTDMVLDIDLAGSTFDTKIYIYRENLKLVACNDDFYSDYTSLLENVVLITRALLDHA